ncbi:MAG: YceI family protein [Bacteroidetes bacterium]|nr:YceI family protein [Bacteroidota bacterium]
MKRRSYLIGKIALLLGGLSLSLLASAQVHYTGNEISLLVNGTSTLHDWNMKSAKADATAVFDFNAAGAITNIQQLTFSMQANALKSEHSSMDNNAYKALKTPTITYTLTSVTVTPGAAGASTVKCLGKLTIAGTTKDAELVAQCKPNADNTVTVTGTRSISMKDFNIAPPTFMLGAVKTGNDVTINFTMQLKKS